MTRISDSVPVARAVAVAILVGLVALAYLAVIAPLQRWIDASGTELEALRVEASTLRSLIEQRAYWESARTDTVSGVADTGLLLGGADTASTQAMLLTRSRELAASNGLTVLSTEARPSEVAGTLVRLPVVLKSEGSDDALTGFLSGMAMSRPLMIAERISIRAANTADPSQTRYTAEFTLVALGRPSP